MAKIATYDAVVSPRAQLTMPRSQAMNSVFQAQSSVANSLTELGSTLINMNDTIQGAKATGDIINKGSMLDATQFAQMGRLYEGYQMDKLQNNTEAASDKLNQMSMMIDPTGAITENVGGLFATTQDKVIATAYEKLSSNMQLKAKDPGEFYLRRPSVIDITKGDGSRTKERDEAMIDEQIKYGISPSKLKVLTNTEAKNYVESLLEEQDPDQARAKWEQMKADPHFDKVWRQMSEHGLPSSMKLLPHMDIKYNTAFFNAMKITDNQIDEYYSKRPGENSGNLFNPVSTIFDEFFGALTGGNVIKEGAITPDMQDLGERLTFFIMNSQNLSEEKASEKAYEIITSGFDMVNDDVGNYVLPKAQGLPADLIYSKLEMIKKNDRHFDLFWEEVSPKIPGTMLEGLQKDIEARDMIFKDYVKENMQFINADDTGDGFYALLKFPDAAMAQPLADQKGRPYVLTFEDLDKYTVGSRLYRRKNPVTPEDESFESQVIKSRKERR